MNRRLDFHRFFYGKNEFLNVVNTVLFLESFVQETMDSTGIGRKSLNDSTPPQKRVLSSNNNNTPKIVKIQHYSSKTRRPINSTIVYLAKLFRQNGIR